MKVLFAASEAMPLVKTGGLADVAYALPKSLISLGVDARVIMPKHKAIKEKYAQLIEDVAWTRINLGWRDAYLGMQTMELDGIRYYFIDNEDYFGGPIYKGDDAENEQYMFFCRAVLEALPYFGFEPDVIHCNDWHTGMIPMLAKTQFALEYPHVKTIYTIHNIQYQGQMDIKFMKDVLSVPDKYFRSSSVEQDGAANMMKAGIVFADKVTTVSPTYAREIVKSDLGMGMQGTLAARGSDLSGIVNGIDNDEFDPSSDAALPAHFDATDIRGKRECKKKLRAMYGLTTEWYAPIISMVTRLTPQKGLDLVRAAADELLATGAAFVLLGSGDCEYEGYFDYLAGKYPGRAGIYIGYDEAKAHMIYAGSDFLLMPSRFEPCGLSQMIAQRYGTLPIVRSTGGLADTVEPYNKYEKTGDGFAFEPYNAHDMMHVINIALSVYREDKPMFRRLRTNAMQRDNSFITSAKEYLELYRKDR
jgi:starch synthase